MKSKDLKNKLKDSMEQHEKLRDLSISYNAIKTIQAFGRIKSQTKVDIYLSSVTENEISIKQNAGRLQGEYALQLLQSDLFKKAIKEVKKNIEHKIKEM